VETLANLESFVRSAEFGNFSAAARRLSLTPAAVSRNVATLERNLGVRLFQRTTRKLTLTEAGDRFLYAIRSNLEELQASIASVSTDRGEPSGTLRLTTGPSFGIEYILPLLPDFRRTYPAIRVDWTFESRQVDLIAEGFDVAIGGGFELAQGVVSRVLAPHHLIAVASSHYLKARIQPRVPSDLASLDGIVMRSSRTRRIRQRPMRNAAGEEMEGLTKATMEFDDPSAMRQAAVLGLGVTQILVADALPYLESGALVRVLPAWYVDAGSILLYYPGRALIPSKTRVFIDFVVKAFQRNRLSERFAAVTKSGRRASRVVEERLRPLAAQKGSRKTL
jgi:DNA-binding transcriptional LysR family regulator